MRILVESLKRLFKNGLNGENPYITKEQIRERVLRGSVSAEEFRYITGEEHVAVEGNRIY